MYHYLLLLIGLIGTCVPAHAQRMATDPKVALTNRENAGLVEIVATNEEYIPCSVIVTFELENMEVVEGREKDTLTIAPRSEAIIYKLEPTNFGEGKGYGYGYDYQFAHGDAKLRPYDTAYVYELPFAPGKTFTVGQGYNGAFSHKGEAALDFNLPEGTPVHAAREGTVVRVIDDNYQHCGEPRCADYNNVIEILHSDGTYADYAHLKQRGAKVKVGQQVARGELIGYSGRTGYASGPHLHFGVYRQTWEQHGHLETLFRVGGEPGAVRLIEGRSYRRLAD